MMAEDNTDVRSAIAVRRWMDVAHSHRLLEQLDAIFFEASGTKTFVDPEARAAFRERWFARYLAQYPQWAYVAIAGDGRVAGYLVGALDEGSGFEDFAARRRRLSRPSARQSRPAIPQSGHWRRFDRSICRRCASRRCQGNARRHLGRRAQRALSPARGDFSGARPHQPAPNHPSACILLGRSLADSGAGLGPHLHFPRRFPAGSVRPSFMGCPGPHARPSARRDCAVTAGSFPRAHPH